MTNAAGQATAGALTANATAGSYVVTATVAGVGAAADFNLTNLVGAAGTISATGGTPQSTVVLTSFGSALQTLVRDAGNNPVSGVTVTFAAPGSGASGTFASGPTATAVTDGTGTATAPPITANSIAGSYTVTAMAAGVATGASFALTNLAGAATTIAATAGTPQSAAIGTAFATSLEAMVVDANNNPVPNVTVTFAAPGSGASGTFASGQTATAVTNASGVATAPALTANGVAGSYTVTATAPGVATGASFALTNTGGAAASITATAGTPQSTTIGTLFTTALKATVVDAGNNPVSGVAVTFTAPGSGASGTFASGQTATAVTNASGVATAPALTANGVAGSYTVMATVPGVATGASFALTNLAGGPATVTAASGTPQSTTVNTAFGIPLQASVRDGQGNLLSGVMVTFTVPGSGAGGSFPGGQNTVTVSSVAGVAAAPVLTANTVTGSYTVTATVAGVAGAGNFTLTNTAGAAAGIAATGGTAQSTAINTAFGSPLQVTVTDGYGNPVSGVTVTFTLPGSGAGGTFAGGVNTAATNAQGQATSWVLTANGFAGNFTVTAAAADVGSTVSFSLTNTAGAAGSIVASGGSGQSVVVNTAFAAVFQSYGGGCGTQPRAHR